MALNRSTRAVTADEAAAAAASGMRVSVHGAAATPTPRMEAPARVVTEYGADDLFGKSRRGRDEALAIAHSDFRAGPLRQLAETRH